MSDLYEVEGKGYGCFALKDIRKGTVIVTDTPKCVAKGVDDPMNLELCGTGSGSHETRKLAINILSAFNLMNQIDRSEFLKLNNNYDGEKYPQTPHMSEYFDLYQKFIQNTIVKSESVKDKLNIIGIYLTQTFGKDGVFIKVSQFNHSCRPNAFSFSALPSLKLVALKNIKAGQEITFSQYDPLSIYLLNRKRRQEVIHTKFLTLCHCDHCGIDDTDSTTNYEELQKLIAEEEILGKECNLANDSRTSKEFNITITTMEARPEDIMNIKRFFSIEKCRNYLKIIHLLFNHGREKKAQAPWLFKILARGYRCAMIGFLLTDDHRNYKKKYRDEALNFAKTALKFEKLLPKEIVDPERWKSIVEDLERPLCYPKI